MCLGLGTRQIINLHWRSAEINGNNAGNVSNGGFEGGTTEKTHEADKMKSKISGTHKQSLSMAAMQAMFAMVALREGQLEKTHEADKMKSKISGVHKQSLEVF